MELYLPPLLEEHGHGGDSNSLEHSLRLEQGSNSHELQLESVPSGLCLQVWEVLGDAALLEEGLGLDLEELELDEFVIGREVAEVGEDGPGLLLAAVVEEPAGGEGHPDHADEEDDGRDNLDTDRDEPGGVGLGLLRGASDVVAAAGRMSVYVYRFDGVRWAY
jgi:hypothetical protein